MSKDSQRQFFRKLRASITPELASVWSAGLAADLITRLRSLGFDGTLFLYSAMPGEPSLLPHILGIRCHIALPRIGSDNELKFHYWAPQDSLVASNFGIMEPEIHAPIVNPRPGDVAVVPALAIDVFGQRLGFGRGYYDRWLARHRQDLSLVIGSVLPPCRASDPLPAEPHDIPVDLCLTLEQSV